MTNTRKYLIIAILCGTPFLVLNLAEAQTANSSPPPFGRGKPSVTQMLTQVLSLTDAQQAQVQAIAEVYQPQLDTIQQQSHDATEVVMRQLTAQIRSFLTAEQQTKLDAFNTLGGMRLPFPPQ